MLTIVSMFISAMLTVTVLGILVVIIQYGGNFVTDQLRSTTLATAQKAWAQDASNASEVKVRDSLQATFYEEPGYRPGVYVPRGDDKANQCRKSVWTLNNGVLTNVVSKFAQAKCDLVTVAGAESVDPAVTPVSTVNALSLSGMDASTRIVANNSADRDLHYVNGVEIGLAPGSAAPSTNIAQPWWRPYEWAFSQPERINIVGKLLLPVSGLRPSTLRGDTSIVPISQGPTATVPEVPPTQTVYDPAIVTNLKVTRSSTTGAIFPKTGGGAREGINVQFGGVTCGPYSTRYDILWTTATPGAPPTRSASAETFDAPLPVDLDKVPNGAVGEVTVTASCPTSTKPSTVTFPYTQPLPTPVLVATAGTQRNVHTLSWAAVTSLAALYSTDLSRDGGAFTVNGTVSPNPTTTTTETISYPLGSTYGVAMANQVTAAVGPTKSSPSEPKTVLTPWPFIAPPALKPSSTGLLLTVTSDPAICPAGTHPEYSQTRNLNGAGTEAPSLWSTNPTVQYVLGEGDQAVITGTARCVYNPAQVSPGSAPVTITFIQPITTMPNPPTITHGYAPNEGDPVNPSYPVTPTTGCPVNTTAEYRTKYSINDGTMSAWSTWAAATSKPILGVHQGDQLSISVTARCVSPYTQGPAGPMTTDTWALPISAPATPQNITNDGGGVSGPKNDRVLYDAVTGCPPGSTVEYRRDHYNVGQEVGYTTALTLDVGASYGTAYDYRVVSRCTSPYISSPDSAWSGHTTWDTNVPAPVAPTVSVPAWAYVGDSFTVVTTGPSCPAPTALHYVVSTSGSGTTWSSARFSDFWPTTGTRSYSAVAYCQGPAARGLDSPAGSDSILIKPKPAPAAPSGLFASAKWYKFCGNIGFTGSIGWSSVAGATSYSVQADWTGTDGARSGWTNEGTTSGTSLDVLQFSSVANSPNVLARVKAVGPGGSSAWTQFSVPLQPGCG